MEIALLRLCTLNRSSPLLLRTDDPSEIRSVSRLEPGRPPDILFLIFAAL
jgi:hypothetical protein